MSKNMERYFDKINNDIMDLYKLANKARKKGIDPVTEVECPPAHDMAGRVENLVGPKGVGDVIRKLKEDGFDQDQVTFKIADLIVEGYFGDKTEAERVDRAIRVALAIKTEGVVSAPLEGISKIKIRDDPNGGPPYLSLYFSGPIRAAGGTVQAFAVLIASHVSQKMGISPYKATKDEVGRMVEEVKLYDRIVNLQYPSTQEELEFAIKHLTVELNGDPTERREVSAYRDMNRIETNFVRSGPCLVLNDGVLLKSKKILKVIDKMKIPNWEWLKDIKKYSHSDDDNKKKEKEADEQKEGEYGSGLYDGKGNQEIEKNIATKGEIETPVMKRRKKLDEKVAPVYKYIADVIGGRPVFSHPSAVGGHRIRYGRSRNTGLAACGMNPNTMYIMNNFLAVGTQIRIERPGKSASVMPVTSIEGPVCLHENGDVVQYNEPNAYDRNGKKNPIKRILFIGDMSFGFGEFAENNYNLVPSGYVEEWWILELEKSLENKGINLKEISNDNKESIEGFEIIRLKQMYDDPFSVKPTGSESLKLSKRFKIALHPSYTFHYGNVNGYDLVNFRDEIVNYYSKNNKKISISENLQAPNNEVCRNFLYKIYCPHKNKNTYLEFDSDISPIFIEILSLDKKFDSKTTKKINDSAKEKVALEIFEYFTTIEIKDKAPYYMGTRMGRPEKAKERKMKPPVNLLFPMGHDTDNNRVIQQAIAGPSLVVDISLKKCNNCGTFTFENLCPKCSNRTTLMKYCRNCNVTYELDHDDCPSCGQNLDSFQRRKIDFSESFDKFLVKLKTSKIPNVKGVKGLSSEFKMSEPIEKGILRALHDVWVFKDGTVRFDALDVPFTHFTPKEIGTSIEKLKEMGYENDYLGNPLVDPKQICELKVQDFIATDHCGDYFVRVSQFVDDELEYIYDMDRFYNCEVKEDLIGVYFAGLAPHTSAAIVGRCIGFAPINSGYGHPYWHAGKRRNCFPRTSEILISKNGIIQRKSFESLYNEISTAEEHDGRIIKKKNSKDDIKAISFDINTNGTVESEIIEVFKTPSSDNLLKIFLRTGRSFTTTTDHPVITIKDDQITNKKAFEVKKGDYLLIPHIEIESRDIQVIDLLSRLMGDEFSVDHEKIMVRGINQIVKSIIEIKGLSETAKFLEINKKTLYNYYGQRDSIPISVLTKLLEYNNISLSQIPNCLLGFKGDHTFIPRYIQFNDDLMKIIGYYIAEGFFRDSGRGYQVDLAVSEDDIRDDMINSIRNIFGNGFKIYQNPNRLTIGSHIFYYFFKNILNLTNTARTKSIPNFIKSFPITKLSKLLAACFSGDGSVDFKQPHISYSSYSYKLIKDIDTILLRFGIFSSISKHKKDQSYEYKIRLYGINYQKYSEKIGFTSVRKTNSMIDGLTNLKIKYNPCFKDHKLVPVTKVEIIEAKEEYVYSLNIKKHHNLIINENILTSNCDGDEDGLLLMLDLLLNFSRFYLPAKIGGKMDAPLVLSVTLDPNEVDGEAHNVDGLDRYPLMFYEKSLEHIKPSEIEKEMGLLKERLGTPAQYEGIKFNLPTTNINFGPKLSSYKTMETMEEKIEAQLDLAVRIDAVDAADVANKILKSHFTPDILGNLRSFSTQGVRCPGCGSKYRRVPLSGKCNKCGGKLILTVSKGGITKYLKKALSMCNRFDLGDYTIQRFGLIDEYVHSLTDNPKVKQVKLTSFFK